MTPDNPPSVLSPVAPATTLLAARPHIGELLEGRGVTTTPLDEESSEVFDNRLATELMALYRDTARKDAFEALYALTRDSVLRWIRVLLRKGKGQLDPTELLQDTFVNVYRYPNGFRVDHPGSFRVWVRTIAGNLIRRRGSRAQRRLSFQELPEGFQEPEDERESPLAHAVEGEENERLREAWVLFLCHYAKAWEGLAQRDRRTLHLVEVEGLSYLEAGKILQVGRSNMKMIVFRSRKRIARGMRQAMRTALAATAGMSERTWSQTSGAA